MPRRAAKIEDGVARSGRPRAGRHERVVDGAAERLLAVGAERRVVARADGASRDDVFKAATILEDVLSLMRRRCGAGHPDTMEALAELDRARMTLEDKFQQ